MIAAGFNEGECQEEGAWGPPGHIEFIVACGTQLLFGMGGLEGGLEE
jgi:hypothetical protein